MSVPRYAGDVPSRSRPACCHDALPRHLVCWPVTQWDDRSIVCITNTHRDPGNPLLREGRLSALHAFEYGAQAAAVHGGLRARSVGTTAAPGYLAALRDGRLHIARLDHIHLPLRICATRLFGDRANTVYECLVSAASILVAEGRTIIIERT